MTQGPSNTVKLVPKAERSDPKPNTGAPPDFGGGDGDGSGPTDFGPRLSALERSVTEIRTTLAEISKGQAAASLESERMRGDIREGFAKLNGSLDAARESLNSKATKADLTPIEVRVTATKDAVDTRAPTSELSLLRGKVEQLPTTLQLILFTVAVFTAAGISRYFLH